MGFVFVSLCFLFCLWGSFISSLILSLTHWFFSSMLFSLHVFILSPFFPLWLVSSFKPLWSEEKNAWYNFCPLKFVEAHFAVFCEALFCSLAGGLARRIFHVNLKRTCVLLFLDGMPCSCLPKCIWSVVALLLLYWFFVWMICPLIYVGHYKSPTIITSFSVSPFMSLSICFMYLGAPILGAYMLILFLYWSLYI